MSRGRLSYTTPWDTILETPAYGVVGRLLSRLKKRHKFILEQSKQSGILAALIVGRNTAVGTAGDTLMAIA